MTDVSDLTLDVQQSIEIKAPVGDVFEAMLKRISEQFNTPEGSSLSMKLERWAGGRWFRDLDGGVGHLWGFVQVYKPPTLIEIAGPMFMSYPVTGHISFRVEQIAGGCRIDLRHRAFGLIEPDHRAGVSMGWQHLLEGVHECL